MGTHVVAHGPPKSFIIAVCRLFNGPWCVHKLREQFCTLYRSKMENFAKQFFDIVTTCLRTCIIHALAGGGMICPMMTISWGCGCWESMGRLSPILARTSEWLFP